MVGLLWGGSSHAMPTNLKDLPVEVHTKILKNVPDEDLYSLYKVHNGAISLAAQYELISRGRLTTFNMISMTEHDLPYLVTFLKQRAHAKILTIKDLRVDLLLQALKTLKEEHPDFTFGPLQTFAVRRIINFDINNLNGLLHLLDRRMFPALTSLDLTGNNIGDTGAQAIAESLNMARLTSLSLGSNNIGVAGAQAIAGSPNMESLTSLNLGGNRIGDTGVQAIAGSPRMARLTSLSLGGNKIGAAGALAIAGSLNMESLTFLNLMFNNIGDTGALAIAGSPNMARLTFLNLVINNIGEVGLEAIRTSANLLLARLARGIEL